MQPTEVWFPKRRTANSLPRYCNLNLLELTMMSSVTSARKLGVAARILGKQVRRTRTFEALLKGGRATGVHFSRIFHQLWLEVTGFVFLALSAVGVLAFAHEWTKYQLTRANSSRLVLAVCFTLMFGWFGFSSFWRVRKKDGRSHKV